MSELRYIIAAICLVLMSLVGASAASITDSDVSRILKRLDGELAHRDKYIDKRHQVIDSLIVDIRQSTDTARLAPLLALGDTYRVFNTDSAVYCYTLGQNEARKLGLDSVALRFAMRKATYLPLLLFFQESRQLMDSISHVTIPPGLEAEKADAERQMSFYTANFFIEFPAYYDSIIAEGRAAKDRLISLLPKESPQYKLNLAERLYTRREFTQARAIAESLLRELDVDHPYYARTCHVLADVASSTGDQSGHLYYLALSAISDTRCATLEVTSLQELGQLLYNKGDIDRAHAYLSVALSNAVECHAALRTLQTSRSLPYIEEAHQSELRSSNRITNIVMVVMAILLIVLAVAVKNIFDRNHRLNKLTRNLAEANQTKDLYIAQFLNLCSIYMDKLTQFNKMVNRKLTAGKADDLIKLTKSGKFIEEQSREFYEVFDDAFLHLYPDFVSQVNALLEPDKQIVLREGEKMTTDLRILALMRLGIDDSPRIAQMLNYSINTIYTYRNKFKSRAIARDTFESDVMTIRAEAPGDLAQPAKQDS